MWEGKGMLERFRSFLKSQIARFKNENRGLIAILSRVANFVDRHFDLVIEPALET